MNDTPPPFSPEVEEEEEANNLFQQTTAHNHYYISLGMGPNGLEDVMCECGSGAQIVATLQVVNGKLVPTGV